MYNLLTLMNMIKDWEISMSRHRSIEDLAINRRCDTVSFSQ